jgi:hypothetical protein
MGENLFQTVEKICAAYFDIVPEKWGKYEERKRERVKLKMFTGT